MPWPSNIDNDPNAAHITMESVIRISPTTGTLGAGAMATISAGITARTGNAPLRTFLDAPAVVAVMPCDRELWAYLGIIMSAMAAQGFAGTVTGFEQGRTF